VDIILEFIKCKHQKLDENGDDDDDPPALVTYKKAKNCISPGYSIILYG